jgi:hypothetical protein
MRATRWATALLTVPVLALTACGGSSDKDKISDFIKDVGKNPTVLCDHLAKDALAQIGGVDKCKQAAKAPDAADPNVKVDSVDVSGDKATAKITGNQGAQTLTLVKEDGDWKLQAEA